MDEFIEVLEQLHITYSVEEQVIKFTCLDSQEINYDIQAKTFNVGTDNFGLVPHVLEDGCVCLFSIGVDSERIRASLDSFANGDIFKSIVAEYIPWIFGIDSNSKVAEFIGELEYFVPKILRKSCNDNLDQKKIKANLSQICITTPTELWHALRELVKGEITYIYPMDLIEMGIYIVKKEDGNFSCCFDEYKRARQRVVGLNVSAIDDVYGFIGVGSVNSYIIKKSFELGVHKAILCDDAQFEMGNAFRFAFPYKNSSKVECVEKFAKIFNGNVLVEKHNIRIEENTQKNYIQNIDKVFVSVDSLGSWLDCRRYLEKCRFNGYVIFVGIDVYGRYGKYLMTRSYRNLVPALLKFLTYESGEERSYLIPNGCGKNLSIYGDMLLTCLATKVLSNTEMDTVKVVHFDEKNIN